MDTSSLFNSFRGDGELSILVRDSYSLRDPGNPRNPRNMDSPNSLNALSEATAKNKNLWAGNTFGGKPGSEGHRRFMETFLKDVESRGVKVDPVVISRIKAEGWDAVFGRNSKNFNNPKAIYQSPKGKEDPERDGRPAMDFINLTLDEFEKLERQNYFNKRGGGANEKELGFIVALKAAEITGYRDESSLYDFITDEANRAHIESLINEVDGAKLSEDLYFGIIEDKNIKSSIGCAFQFLSLGVSYGRNFHHKSKLSEGLKKDAGGKTRVGNADKWNPADVFICTDRGDSLLASLKNETNIADLNHKFNEAVRSGDIIPISLKASAEASLGSYSIESLSKRLANAKLPKPRELAPADAKGITKTIKNIVSKSGIPVLCSINKGGNVRHKVNKTFKNTTDLFSDEEFLVGLNTSTSNSKVYPPALEWMESLSQEKEGIRGILEFGILVAYSLAPESSTFYIVTPKYAKIKENGGGHVEIQSIELQPNTASILLHHTLEYDGKVATSTCQIRPKGTYVNFVTYAEVRGTGQAEIPIG